MKKITSLSNPKIINYSKLKLKKYRREKKLFIVEGYHMVQEAQKAGIVLEILTSDEQLDGTKVSDEIIKKLTDSVTPQKIIAVCKMIKPGKISQKIVALDNVQDPGNVGTIIRTAAAFGYTDVIVKGADIYSPKVLRSTQGAIFKLNVIQTGDITTFFGDYNIIGSIIDKNAKSYNTIIAKKPFFLVLGNEGSGLSDEVIKRLNEKVYIPIDFESLNVASAAAILLNEYK